MLTKTVLSIAAACFLSVSDVIAAEQKQAKYALSFAELSHEEITARLNTTYGDDDEIPGEHIAVRLFSEPDAHPDAYRVSIQYAALEGGRCVDLPSGTYVLSTSISNAVKCCLLYRSPCPEVPRLEGLAQNPGFFHQKFFSPIRDMRHYGFTHRPKSIVCPAAEICQAFWQDRNWSPEQLQNMGPYWVDIRSLPYREFI